MGEDSDDVGSHTFLLCGLGEELLEVGVSLEVRDSQGEHLVMVGRHIPALHKSTTLREEGSGEVRFLSSSRCWVPGVPVSGEAHGPARVWCRGEHGEKSTGKCWCGDGGGRVARGC